MLRSRWLIGLVAVWGFSPAAAVAGIVVTFFPGSTYSPDIAAMDAALGISGYAIEDFEDTLLLPGLTIAFDGNINDTSYGILPKTFDSAGESQTANNFWDGTRVLTNAGNGTNGPFLPPAATNTTFSLATPTAVLGLGLANFQSATSSSTNPFPVTDHTLFVNGVALGTVESLAGAAWTGGVEVRNVYVRVAGTEGELIHSLRFRNDSASDFLVFDRLAVYAPPVVVPEPSAWLGLGVAAVCLASKRRVSR